MMFKPSGEVTSQPPTFFNPSSVSSLPSIPEMPGPGSRKGFLTRQGSLPSRRGSKVRSRQASESKDAHPPMMMPKPASGNMSQPSVMTPPLSMLPSIPPFTAPAPTPKEASDMKPAPAKKKEGQDGGVAKKSSCFGGILSKIIKNDNVHLPDDKDKRIVYDEAKKRWVNLDEDEDSQGLAAPPMDPAFSAPATGAPGGGAAPVPSRQASESKDAPPSMMMPMSASGSMSQPSSNIIASKRFMSYEARTFIEGGSNGHLTKDLQDYGIRLYPRVQQIRPNMAGKITGMMLELTNTQLVYLLGSREYFKLTVEEAVKIIKSVEGDSSASGAVQSRGSPAASSNLLPVNTSGGSQELEPAPPAHQDSLSPLDVFNLATSHPASSAPPPLSSAHMTSPSIVSSKAAAHHSTPVSSQEKMDIEQGGDENTPPFYQPGRRGGSSAGGAGGGQSSATATSNLLPVNTSTASQEPELAPHQDSLSPQDVFNLATSRPAQPDLPPPLVPQSEKKIRKKRVQSRSLSVSADEFRPESPNNEISKQLKKLGHQLYKKVSKISPSMASKVTGMLMDLQQYKLKELLVNPNMLEERIQQCLTLLETDRPEPIVTGNKGDLINS